VGSRSVCSFLRAPGDGPLRGALKTPHPRRWDACSLLRTAAASLLHLVPLFVRCSTLLALCGASGLRKWVILSTGAVHVRDISGQRGVVHVVDHRAFSANFSTVASTAAVPSTNAPLVPTRRPSRRRPRCARPPSRRRPRSVALLPTDGGRANPACLPPAVIRSWALLRQPSARC